MKRPLLMISCMMLAFILRSTPAVGGTADQANGAQSPKRTYVSSLHGRGVALLGVDYKSGHVTSFQIVESTGNAALDEAAESAFLQHAFKPGTVRGPMRASLNFTLTQRVQASARTTPGVQRKARSRHTPVLRQISETTTTSALRRSLRQMAAAKPNATPAAASKVASLR